MLRKNALEFQKTRQPGRRVKLEHECVPIPVEHHAGPAIALAVDPAEAGGLRIEQPLTKPHRFRQTLRPPTAVNWLGLASLQDANADRRFRIEQARRQELVLAIINNRQLAGRGLPICFTNALGKYPGMS